MRYFSLLDLQHLVLALFLGLVGVILAAVAWGGYPRRNGEAPPAPEGDVPPAAEDNPVPPFLLFVYVGVLVGALGYAVVAALVGSPVGY